MNEPLVSIIIPAFNVQNYIIKCVDSALEQSYENIEVIIVNDGSTDDTAIKLIKYSSDIRVRVLTQQNSGVSSARNHGLNHANGEYVVFIDGDDFISPRFVEYMVDLAVKHDADMFVSLNCITDKNQIDDKNSDHIRVLSSDEATALLLSPRIIVGCWNKIYRRSLLEDNNIRFRQDLFHGEGLFFITECSQNALNVGVCERPLYFYRRNNVFSATTNTNIERLRNGEKSLEEIEQNLRNKQSQIINEMLMLHKCLYWSNCLIQIINSKGKSNYKNDYLRWKSKLCSNFFKVLKYKSVKKYYKLLLIAGRYCPHFLAYLVKKKRQRDAINSPQ